MSGLAFVDFSDSLSVAFSGSRDEFYLAPEYQEHGIVTEKVCLSKLLYFLN